MEGRAPVPGGVLLHRKARGPLRAVIEAIGPAREALDRRVRLAVDGDPVSMRGAAPARAKPAKGVTRRGRRGYFGLPFAPRKVPA